MGKKSANNAIDFARLFAVKEQVARQADMPVANEVSEPNAPVPHDDAEYRDVQTVTANEKVVATVPTVQAEPVETTVLQFAAPISTRDQTANRSMPEEEPGGKLRVQPA